MLSRLVVACNKPCVRNGMYVLLGASAAVLTASAVFKCGGSKFHRALLPHVLNRANVPHGDMVVPGNVASGRFFISQWQRIAAGAIAVVLAWDAEGNMYTIIGDQQKKLMTPRGYGEWPVPSEDATGVLRKAGASRFHAKTKEAVTADFSMQDVARHEIEQESGLALDKLSYTMHEVGSELQTKERAPVTLAAEYIVQIHSQTIDKLSLSSDNNDEFAGDLEKPRWVRVDKQLLENPILDEVAKRILTKIIDDPKSMGVSRNAKYIPIFASRIENKSESLSRA